MKRVKSVMPLAGYRLGIELEDGLAGMIDLSAELYGEVFEPLRDPVRFGQVMVDELGVVCWPNGADLAPEFVYDEVRKTSPQPSIDS